LLLLNNPALSAAVSTQSSTYFHDSFQLNREVLGNLKGSATHPRHRTLCLSLKPMS